MKVRYAIRRTINCGNFENIVLEYELEEDVDGQQEHDALIESVEAFIEEKEEEIRKQLEG